MLLLSQPCASVVISGTEKEKASICSLGTGGAKKVSRAWRATGATSPEAMRRVISCSSPKHGDVTFRELLKPWATAALSCLFQPQQVACCVQETLGWTSVPTMLCTTQWVLGACCLAAFPPVSEAMWLLQPPSGCSRSHWEASFLQEHLPILGSRCSQLCIGIP